LFNEKINFYLGSFTHLIERKKYRIIKMKKKNNLKILSIISYISFILMMSCTPDTTPSLYDNVGESLPPAEITSITPASGYAGVTVFTIDGKNFAPLAGDNLVYFSPAKAEILSASETQLVVKAPIIYGDSLRVYTQKKGAELISNTKLCQLTNAVNEYYPFFSYQAPYSATSDLDGNIYFSLTENGTGIGVWKITADSSKLVEFAPIKSETFYNDLKYHSDGYLLGVALRYKYAIFQINEGEIPVVWAAASDKSLVFQAIDFDVNKNLWASGKGGKIVSFTPDKTYAEFEYENEIKALRVYDNYLYAISNSVAGDDVVRFQIFSSDSLGTPESVFNFSGNVGDPTISANSLTFSADGDMYIGTNAEDGVIVVYLDGSFGTWYEGLILPDIISFTWTTGTNIFATRKAVSGVSEQNIYIIDMERAGAPEFGRD